MKRLSYILLAAMLVAALAVSCTAEVIDDMGLVSVGFEGVRDNGSKGLTVAQATLDVYDSSISWTYKAYKNVDDNTPATGTKTDETKLEGGISAGKLTLSQGVWNFELFGYVNDVLVYQGKAIKQSINGKNATVQIKVSPLKTEEGKGALVFKDGIVIVDGTGKSFSANYAEYKVLDADSLIGINLNEDGDKKVTDLKSAVYEVTVYCKDKDFIYAQASVVVTIYDGLESVISGTLDENTAEAGFGVIKVDAAAGTTSQSQAVDSAKTKYEFGFSPANSDDAKTVVEVVGGSFVPEAGAENHTVDLVVYNKDAAEKKFVISDGSGMVFAGLDLSLNGASFAENTKVKVSTYIKAELPGTPKVVYNGDPSEPFDVTYNSKKGLLEFETKHFSEYYVVFEGLVAYNETAGKYYKSLWTSIKEANDGNRIQILEDISLSSSVLIGGSRTRKNVIINLNGKTISGKVANDSMFRIGNAEVVFEGPGTIQDTLKNFGEIRAIGSDDESVSKYTVVTVNKDVVLKDGQAIWVDTNFKKEYINYGVEVNFYGTADLSDTEDYAFYVQGRCTEKQNSPVFNLEGAHILTKALGIYAAGYANWNIKNTTISGVNTAIEIRAGIMNIDGGKFTASAAGPTVVTPEENGTTTVGSSIAIAQHNTKLPISVTISDGVFEGYSALYEADPQNNKPENVKINVKGGTFNAVNGGSVAVFRKDCTGFITGGTFNSDPSSYVADGYISVRSEDENSYTVRKLAEGEKAVADYETLKEAVKEGGTIIITNDIIVDDTIAVVGKSVVLNMNGKTLSNTKDLWSDATGNWSLISVRNNGNLTITGN